MYITLIIKFSRKFFFFFNLCILQASYSHEIEIFFHHLIENYFKPPPYTPVQWPI